MAQEWYAQIDGITAGPFELSRLRELAVQGKVTADTPVRSGDEPWTRAASVRGLLGESDGLMGTVDGGSRHGFKIDPSMNDTTEWRMLAESASVPAVEENRPLPRRPVEAARAGDPASTGSGASRTLLIVGAGIVAVIGVFAILFALFVS